MIKKEPRIKHQGYLRWVASLPCSECEIHDDTIVAHHLKSAGVPLLSGGGGRKANDYFAMPLCFTCHDKLHKGNKDLCESQLYRIMQTLDKAFKDGIIWFMRWD